MMLTRRAARVLERDIFAYRRMWLVFVAGFVEPVLFLLSIGLGVGQLVGDIHVGDHVVSYKEFVAPAMLAVSAMYGAVFDVTITFFVRYKYQHTYDAMLATPVNTTDVAVGEVLWSVARGSIYSAGFVVIMLAFGLVGSWWVILAVPAAVAIGFAFAGAGLAMTTFMRSFLDFEWVNIAVVPLLLFSATFFPLSQYPDWVQTIVKCTPLYQGVVLERSLIIGDVSWTLLLHAAYLLVMGAWGTRVAARRLAVLIQP